jgi:hypothetical protein
MKVQDKTSSLYSSQDESEWQNIWEKRKAPTKLHLESLFHIFFFNFVNYMIK